MTLRILSLTFNDLTSWNWIEPRIITSKSETDPQNRAKNGLTDHTVLCYKALALIRVSKNKKK